MESQWLMELTGFREAFDDLEITLSGTSTAGMGLFGKEGGGTQINQRPHPSKSFTCKSFLPTSPVSQRKIKEVIWTHTGLWIDISRTRGSLGRPGLALWLNRSAGTLGNQIFGTNRNVAAHEKTGFLWEVTLLVLVMGTSPSGHHASQWWYDHSFSWVFWPVCNKDHCAARCLNSLCSLIGIISCHATSSKCKLYWHVLILNT